LDRYFTHITNESLKSERKPVENPSHDSCACMKLAGIVETCPTHCQVSIKIGGQVNAFAIRR